MTWSGASSGEHFVASNPPIPKTTYVGSASGVDDTALINAAIATAMSTNAGGTVVLTDEVTRYVCLGALVIPYTGPAGAPVQVPLRITSIAGPNWNGYWAANPINGGPILDLRYAGGDGTHVAKIDTRGAGYLEIDHLTLASGGTDNYLFMQTTNTTVRIHDYAVIGNLTNSGTACLQDFIKLGGSASSVIGNGSDAPFQGYGSKISDGFFSNIRKGVIPGTYCNNITIEDLTFSATCGSGDAQGAPITFAPLSGSGKGCIGNNIRGCTVEAASYRYGVAFMNDCYDNLIAGLGIWDVNGYTLGAVYCGATSVNGNIQIAGELHSSLVTKYFDGPNALNNLLLVAKSGASSVFPGEVLIGPGAITSTTPGDLTVSRGGASPGTGQISFGSAAAGTHAIYYDGTRFNFNDTIRAPQLDQVSTGNLYIGPSVANQVNIGNAAAPIRFDGALISNGTQAPSTSNLGANVSSATVAGNNVRGTVTITAGASPIAGPLRICTMTFSATMPHTAAPRITVNNSTTGAADATHSLSQYGTAAETSTTWDLWLISGNINALAVVKMDYWCIE